MYLGSFAVRASQLQILQTKSRIQKKKKEKKKSWHPEGERQREGERLKWGNVWGAKWEVEVEVAAAVAAAAANYWQIEQEFDGNMSGRRELEQFGSKVKWIFRKIRNMGKFEAESDTDKDVV